MKTTYTVAIAALLACGIIGNLSGQEAVPRDIAADFVVRDAKTAARRAEDFFTNQASVWEQKARPFRAESTVFARSPVESGTLKKGDPIWVVVVVNDAQSVVIQVPLGILWIRAKDGAVFLTRPSEANHSPEPTPGAVH